MVEKKAAPAKQDAAVKQKAVAKQVAAPKQAKEKIGVGRLLGMVGGIVILVGTLLPWATLSGGRYDPPAIYLGVMTGFFGVLISQLGFFGIIMMIDGKKTTSLGGLILGASALTFSGLVAAFAGWMNLGDIGGITVEVGFGVYVCIAGSIVLLLGSLLAMLQARKPRTIPIPPAKPAKKGRPIEAYVLFAAALAGAILLLAYPWTYGKLDATGAMYLLFGVMLAPTCLYALKVEYWTWGTILIVMVLIVLFAILASTIVLLVYADAIAVILLSTKTTYGVGVWKIDQAREEEHRKVREVVRTANPEGLHCPSCKSNDVYICDDGSTFCRSCRTGFVNIHDASAKPKSSMQGT